MAILFVIVGISVLILIHEAGHFWAAKKAGLLVEEFGFGFPPRLFKKKIGETTYSFNLLPFGGYVRIYGEQEVIGELGDRARPGVDPSRSFAKQSVWRRIVIIGAGVAMNFILGWFLLSAIFMLGAPKELVVAQVLENSPAAVSGLKQGDVVVGYEEAESFISYINENLGQSISFEVKRGDEILPVLSTPRQNPKPDEGALGVALVDSGFEGLGFFSALKQGFIQSIEIMAQIIKLFGKLIGDLFTKGKVLDDVVGPVGVFSVAHQAGERGFIYLLQLIALISLNLAALNALPFPALDGGRALFVLIEKIKGSPIAPKRELAWNATGIVFLLLLMIVITTRDIIRLF